MPTLAPATREQIPPEYEYTGTGIVLQYNSIYIYYSKIGTAQYSIIHIGTVINQIWKKNIKICIFINVSLDSSSSETIYYDEERDYYVSNDGPFKGIIYFFTFSQKNVGTFGKFHTSNSFWQSMEESRYYLKCIIFFRAFLLSNEINWFLM